MKTKQWIGTLLLFVIMCFTLAACNSKEVSNKPSKDTDKTTVMGRYMQQDITLPEELNTDKIISVLKGTNGLLEIYTSEENTYYCYQEKENDTFEKIAQPWLSSDEGNVETQIFYGEDDGLYAYSKVYLTDTVYTSVMKASDDRQSAKQLDLAFLKQLVRETDGYKIYPIISKMNVLKNGNFVVTDRMSNKIEILDATSGNEISALTVFQETNSSDSVSFTVKDNTIITMNATGDKLIVYNTETEKTDREIEINDVSETTIYDVDDEGNIYRCDKNGISKIAPDGSLWENLVDGSLNMLSMPSVTLLQFMKYNMVEDKPIFYCHLYDASDNSIKLVKFVYDGSVPSVPAKELTIYSLKENSTVRQAVARFQQLDSNIKVTYNVAMSEDKSLTVEDYIKALNSELLAGKGADLIVLDGLPMESYVEKGVLADIKDLFDTLKQEGQLVPDMLNSYVQEEKVYAIPSRFELPLLFGTKEAVEAGNSIATLYDYVKNQGDKAVLHPLTGEDMTSLLMTYYYNEVILPNKSIDESALMNLLEIVKAELGDEDNNYADNMQGDWNKVTKRMGSDSAVSLAKQQITLGMDDLISVSGMMLPFSIIDKNQYSYSTRNHSYLPTGVVGINQASKNKEQAQQFIQCLLSEPVQTSRLYDGFPVNPVSLKEWFDEQNDDVILAISSDDGTDLEAMWPDKKYREELYNQVVALTTPITPNEILIQKITDAAKQYYSGKATKEEVIQMIQSSISTYLDE